MHILTGIDLPLDSVCGSLLLVNDLYRSLRRAGHQVTFIGLKPSKDVSVVDGATAIEVSKANPYDDRYIEALMKKLRLLGTSCDADILHIHHLGYGMAQALPRVFSSLPVLGFAHGTDVYDAQRDPKAAQLAGKIAASCDLVIFPTVSLFREALDAAIPLDHQKITIIPWGIPDELAAMNLPDLDGNRPGRLRVLAAGRLTANKDFATAVRAIAELPTIYDMHLFGSGREEAALRDEIQARDLNDRVTLRPMVPRVNLWKCMASFACAVFPTRETEAFGLFGVECQRRGLPLIVSSLPVFGEVFGSSADRFMAGDEFSLSRAIRRTCETPARRATFANAGIVNSSRYKIDLQAQLVEHTSLRLMSACG